MFWSQKYKNNQPTTVELVVKLYGTYTHIQRWIKSRANILFNHLHELNHMQGYCIWILHKKKQIDAQVNRSNSDCIILVSDCYTK